MISGGARWRVLAVAVLLVAVACSKSEMSAGLQGAPMVVAYGEGACGLLATEELELVLNAPVDAGARSRDRRPEPTGPPETATAERPPPAGPPQAPGPAEGENAEPAAEEVPEPAADERDAPKAPSSRVAEAEERGVLGGMDMCRANSDEGFVAWGVLGEDETKKPVAEVFKGYRDWHQDYLEPTRVAGNEAVWDEGLHTLLVLADEHVIAVQLVVANPPIGGGEQEGEEDANGEEDEGDAEGTDSEGATGEDHEESVDPREELSEQEATYLREQATELVNRALRRL